MAKIPLSSGFTIIPEGHYMFKITGVDYKESFGKLTINMATKDGQKHVEKYSLLRNDGSTNDGAIGAFSYFAKTALNNYDATEVDPADLVNCFIEGDIEHDVQENRNKPGTTVTFVHLSNLKPCEGWENTATARPNLMSLLG